MKPILGPGMRPVLAAIARYGPTPFPVLIQGETGTGKDLVAQALHAESGRTGRLLALNCGAIPDELFESELFGHVKGAFTGADRERAGAFRVSHTGTLFLDEIGELSTRAQAKLLRAIESAEVTPVGADRPVHVDVRILSATACGLRDAVARGRFRLDLFHRIATTMIACPPLRERREDVAVLAEAYLRHLHLDRGMPGRFLSGGALMVLREWQWPGNVRELHAVLARLACADGPAEIEEDEARAVLTETVIEAMERSPETWRPPWEFATEGIDLPGVVRETERRCVTRALALTTYRVRDAALLLNLGRTTLHEKMVRLGIGARQRSRATA